VIFPPIFFVLWQPNGLKKQHLSNFIKLEKYPLADDEGFFQALAPQGLG
jgi:hypothetical protein